MIYILTALDSNRNTMTLSFTAESAPKAFKTACGLLVGTGSTFVNLKAKPSASKRLRGGACVVCRVIDRQTETLRVFVYDKGSKQGLFHSEMDVHNVYREAESDGYNASIQYFKNAGEAYYYCRTQESEWQAKQNN